MQKMRYIKYILCVFMSVNFEALADKKCPDCINIIKCDSALKYLEPLNDTNTQKIRDAFCGFNDLGSMICCSLFQPEETTKAFITLPMQIKEEPDQFNENHPNLRLLPDSCGDLETQKSRITNGIAKKNEFSWIALITYYTNRGGHQSECSGTVINSRHILTAAHCVVGKNLAGIRVGEYNRSYTEECYNGVCEYDFRIRDVIVHKNYSGSPFYLHDIALLRVRERIDFEYINAVPVCLPKTKELREMSIIDQYAIEARWRITEHEHDLHIPLKVPVLVQSPQVCQIFYGQSLNEHSTQLCVWDNNSDSCSGYSDGPLIKEAKYNNVSRYVQFGTVTDGFSRCGTSPGIYTDVRKYMDWILDHIKE